MKDLNVSGTYDSATMPEMVKTMNRLAADQELRISVEHEVRAGLLPGWSFWIDDFGCGHIGMPLHISSSGGGK